MMPVLIFLLITFSGTPFSKDPQKLTVVIWNVGQGQWVTVIMPEKCIHFDMGGEFYPLNPIKQNCSRKTNHAFLSHSDWDHISALKKVRNILRNLCIEELPKVVTSKKKLTLLQSWPLCKNSLDPDIDRYSSNQSSNSNESSTVFGFRGFLLPGDSPKSQEYFWKNLSWVQRSKVLVLGHHGSSTSTSDELLLHLPRLRLAISSARWARYRHPSPQVILSLKRSRVSLLKTEDWGNIWIPLEQ